MKVDVDATLLEAVKALAEPLRLRIVQLLAAEELCVCHLVEELDVPQPLVSHHLRVLRDARLVESSKYRYWTYYRLRTEPLEAAGRELVSLASAAPSNGEQRRPCC
ncbi:MAG: metalloregulator ArsR/SmtB family transcription factor [Actinomycetota bacterium]|nr:helix-turn-helix transcriptional regulator [Acidimicrobiia bacterium]MDQ3293452.1 metalloregulator ArsR/SmtB family transcription factor [Actinomycetota bacterium]